MPVWTGAKVMSKVKPKSDTVARVERASSKSRVYARRADARDAAQLGSARLGFCARKSAGSHSVVHRVMGVMYSPQVCGKRELRLND